MNKSQVSPTVRSSGDVAQSAGGAGVRAVAAPRPGNAGRRSGRTAGRIAALVIGALLTLVSVVFLGGGGTLLWADRTQRDEGYVTTDIHGFATGGSALATERTTLGSAGNGWLYAPALLDKIRIRVTAANSGVPLFVGIGPSAEVDRYLAGVDHTVISDFRTDRVEVVRGGGAAASAPGTQDFWVGSATGTGVRTLTWAPADGSWTVVVMNADGRPGVDVRADLGARLPALPWIAIGLLAAGAVFAAGGTLLVAGAVRHRHAERGVAGADRSDVGAPPV